MSRRVRFWASAVAVALLFALAAALLLPYEALQLRTGVERWRAWLLSLWTAGVMAVLFGFTGLVGFLTPVGIREVVEAGSVTKALAERRSSRRADDPGFHGNFAWWLVATGGLLIGIYFVSWGILRV